MKAQKKVIIFAKEKPGVDQALQYLHAHFSDANLFKGNVGDPFPKAALSETADICISYISPWIIPVEVLNMTKEFSINFHPGPPEYPGIGCTNFAIYEGAEEFAIMAHIMEQKVDTGKIVKVKRFPISNMDSVYSLTQKCYGHILDTFYEVFDHYLKNGELPESDEQWKRKPFTRKQLNELCRLTPDMSREEMLRRIRATEFPGMPGAFIEISGIKFIYKSPESS